jgi:hypothetical protein
MKPTKILLIDTETISIEKRYIYDFGYIIAELENEQYIPLVKSQNIIEQIYDNLALFTTAYYENKRNTYTKLMQGRTAKKNKYGYVMQTLKHLIKEHDIQYVIAYNSSFDKGAIEFTTNFFKTQDIFKGLIWLDLLAISNNLIHLHESYIDKAKEKNWFNVSGYLQTNAENTYAFLTENYDFKEEHTSLQDCEIELHILNECVKRGFDIETNYKSKYILSGAKQYFRIEHNGKNYSFGYNKKINRKNGIISLTS